MDPFTVFQAAMIGVGAISKIFSGDERKKQAEQGAAIEKAGIASNMEAIRLQSAEQSLERLKQLRKTLATQNAMSAARGTATNIGSAFFISQHSEGEFNREERFRRISEKSQLASLKAKSLMSDLGLEQTKSQISSDVTSTLFNMLPVSSVLNEGLFGGQSKPAN